MPDRRSKHKRGEKCSVEDCFNKIVSIGFCSIHRDRWYNHGSTEPLRIRNIDWDNREQIEKLLLKYKKVKIATGCWEWSRGRDKNNYGQINYRGILTGIHRISAHIWKGFDIKSKLFICHHCDNPPCFNPEHLFIGTATENHKDMVKKGRHSKTHLLGTKNHLAKLNPDKVRELRLLSKCGFSQRNLANKFGVSQSQVWCVLSGRTWAHVI